jgi:quercetin dioxygenase-like cupin family protein
MPDVNRFVPAPLSAGADSRRPQLTSRVYPLRLPLPPDQENGWKPYPVFRGSTGDVQDLSCHVSTLRQNHSPHPPHTHKEEELLFVLAGEVDLTLPDLRAAGGHERRRLKAGQLVYYPAHFAHTLETVSQTPANYLMFKWHAESAATDAALAFAQLDVFDPSRPGEVQEGYRKRPVFQGPTAYLRKLHCHATTLTPGAGYEPHVDAYDVAIVVLDGEVETLGQRVGPHGVIFYPAGESHGMRNPGDTVARYVVFEFHGSRTALKAALPKMPPLFLARLTDRRRWKSKLRHLSKRLSQRLRR